MAEGVVSFGLEKLWELLSRESERLSGINEQVDGLKRKLRRLQSLLKDAYAKKHESERVKSFLEDVEDIVYDAEDLIESFLLKGKEKGIKKRVQRLACFLVDRMRFASDIEGITKRIYVVIEEMQSFGIQQIIDSGHSLSLQGRQREQREIRKVFSNGPESDLVGLDKSVEELVGRLVENDNSFQVVSITGMGGIGKTTLARQVFRHGSVRRHFDGFAWVSVSQEFTQKHIWQRILQDLRPHDHENILKMDEYTLHDKLFQLLKTSRYLIFLDDIWKNEDWDRIKAVFPPKKGWKILLTSRNETVGFHADSRCFSFRPRILTGEESWNLCQRIVFPRRDETDFRVDEELESLGKKMVTYCGGLPLAVRVLGGLLATKHTAYEWERVRENIRPQIVGGITYGIVDVNNASTVYRILSLSYEDLSMELKRCFLYLAHYPEDYNINMEDLFSCWAAEGMVVLDGSTIRGTGEAYMEELVRRNMVIVGRKIMASRIKKCQMHDMMREVCLSKAKEENFLHVFKVPTSSSTINSQSSSRSRRLVVDSDIAFQTLGDKSNLKVRSVICFAYGKDFWIKPARRFERLPLLRVLDLSYVCFKGSKSLSSIGELIHLRFLSLYNVEGVSHLPSSLGNLKLLLHLNLDVSFGVDVHVPNVLKNMLELRWLRLPFSMDDKTKLDLGELVNLEYLKGFSTEHSSVTDILYMTKLRTLSRFLSKGVPSETLSLSLRELEKLEELWLVVDFAVAGFVLDLNYLIHLKYLKLNSRSLLDQHGFPPHLPHISLQNCRLEEDPMPMLEKLSHLKSVKLSIYAFEGRRMVCSKGGFPQLCALEIETQRHLEELIVEEGSMPCLQTLTITCCKKLKEFPCGLKYITSLKELKIQSMKEELTEKLVPGGEDYYKVQHIPSVQFINCDKKLKMWRHVSAKESGKQTQVPMVAGGGVVVSSRKT